MFALLRRLTRLLQLPDENERLCGRVHELEARLHELEEQLAQARASWTAAATEKRIGTMTNQVSGDGDLRSSHGQLIAAVCAIFGLVVVIASVVIAMFGLVVAASSNPASPSMLEQFTAALRQQAGQSFATEAFK